MSTLPRVVDFADGNRDQRDLLGGKGANLAEMTRLGLPVPPGFTVTTEACREYLASGEFPDGLPEQIDAALARLEERLGRRLGNAEDPLLVSVRSGAPFSMPGMMDTVLDLGLNDETVLGLTAQTGDEQFAWDSYRRFVQLYGKVVMGVSGELFDEALTAAIEDSGAPDERGLDADALRGLVGTFKDIVRRESGTGFPDDPPVQLRAAIEAVFRSWNGRRARDYRRLENIPDDLGTAVNVQAMVFGNLGDRSATGVAFTRNPATGDSHPYGDWLAGAQGEDVVAGIRNTEPLATLGDVFTEAAADLQTVMETLESHYQDMCDIEFTIEQGKLFVLQTRVGKRTARAAVRMAVDMATEGLIDSTEAVRRVPPADLERLLHPSFAPEASYTVLTKGLDASPGAASGKVCFTADEAEAMAAEGEDVLLVRPETSPEDLHGMIAAKGILTSRGGLVSHAAVVARGMGKPAVCGASELSIDVRARTGRVGDTVVNAGDVLSIDGGTGEVVLGSVPLVVPEPDEHLATLLDWADEHARLAVRANADTPEDASTALSFGAVGIGLCRTEHMFLGKRLPVVQRMILAATEAEEEEALAELAEMQRADFVQLFEVMGSLPVTVRLLDPPLHEFLPDVEELLVAQATGELDDYGEALLRAALDWQEENPMLGTRGCRLGIIKPGLYRMQTRALIEAAVEVARGGTSPDVEIMLPLIADATELELLAGWVTETAEKVVADAGLNVHYRVGTMVETPRAALTAGDLARTATFFSFGTNDLTQMTYGFSRDDVERRIIPAYAEKGVLSGNPFEHLDPDGVGRLIDLSVREGRATRPDIQIGVCGEHGGDPQSVRLCHDLGLDYVSCSPFRVPVARLAAAHAALSTTARSAGA